MTMRWDSVVWVGCRLGGASVVSGVMAMMGGMGWIVSGRGEAR